MHKAVHEKIPKKWFIYFFFGQTLSYPWLTPWLSHTILGVAKKQYEPSLQYTYHKYLALISSLPDWLVSADIRRRCGVGASWLNLCAAATGLTSPAAQSSGREEHRPTPRVSTSTEQHICISFNHQKIMLSQFWLKGTGSGQSHCDHVMTDPQGTDFNRVTCFY